MRVVQFRSEEFTPESRSTVLIQMPNEGRPTHISKFVILAVLLFVIIVIVLPILGGI